MIEIKDVKTDPNMEEKESVYMINAFSVLDYIHKNQVPKYVPTISGLEAKVYQIDLTSLEIFIRNNMKPGYFRVPDEGFKERDDTHFHTQVQADKLPPEMSLNGLLGGR